jgi:hypothetical protein
MLMGPARFHGEERKLPVSGDDVIPRKKREVGMSGVQDN